MSRKNYQEPKGAAVGPSHASRSQQSSVTPKAPRFSIMTQLSHFGYYFTPSGQLKSAKDDSAFIFDVYESKDKNQAHYEALGKVINEYVYEEMEKLDKGMRRVSIPADAAPGSPQGFFFASKGAETASTLLILIHGSGALRAGQWSRQLIINRSLDAGSQLPLIRRALRKNWGVVCLNTNQWEDDHGRPIPGSESPAHHGVTVWRQWVAPLTKAQHIIIIAHSAGGGVVGDIANRNRVDFERRVKAVALTDAFCPPNPVIAAVARHWVCSELQLDTPIRWNGAMEERSAGTTVHEEATLKAHGPIWSFLKKRLSVAENGGEKQEQLQGGCSHDDHGNPLKPPEARPAVAQAEHMDCHPSIHNSPRGHYPPEQRQETAGPKTKTANDRSQS